MIIDICRMGEPVKLTDLTKDELTKLINDSFAELVARDRIEYYVGRVMGGGPPLPFAVVRAVCDGGYGPSLHRLHWDYDHWAFDHAGMYVGVEKDGYIHT